MGKMILVGLAVIFLNTCIFVSDAQQSNGFRFATIYGDHMVLQQSSDSTMNKANVWGYVEGCAPVSVMFDGKIIPATLIQEGSKDMCTWRVLLPATAATDVGPPKPYTITATSEKHGSISLKDVLFGDVWVCSGQSNMALTVSRTFNASEEAALAAKYPNIRVFTAALNSSTTPMAELNGIAQQWTMASPTSIPGFSATCWFYGRNLYDNLKYPIGLVASDWGGTPVEAWSSPDALAKCKVSLKSTTNHKQGAVTMTKKQPSVHVTGPATASVLWNAMIYPLLNMTVKGAIWYQGEANSGAPDTYNCTFPAMIDDWREKWSTYTMKQTDPLMGFGFVQLAANLKDNTTVGGFPVIRWAQTANYGYVPNNRMKNVFMAVAMDLGDPDSPNGSIHPRDKQDVGARLALSARAVVYTEKIVDYQGPIPVTADIKRNKGSIEVTVTFRVLGSLVLRYPYGFEVSCSSKGAEPQWLEGTAMSSSVQSVVVGFPDCPSGTSPDMIRYCWRTDPCTFKKCPIYSTSTETELPAAPFVFPLNS